MILYETNILYVFHYFCQNFKKWNQQKNLLAYTGSYFLYLLLHSSLYIVLVVDIARWYCHLFAPFSQKPWI